MSTFAARYQSLSYPWPSDELSTEPFFLVTMHKDDIFLLTLIFYFLSDPRFEAVDWMVLSFIITGCADCFRIRANTGTGKKI
jgi:hypothetical protein